MRALRLLFIAALAAFLASPVLAAVTANSVVTAQTPNVYVCQFLQGTDTAGTYKTCITGAANGTKCFGATETNNDGSATHLITVETVRSSVKYGGTSFTTTASEGYAAGTYAKPFMSSTYWPGLPADGDANPYFILAGSGDTIQATFATALTSSTKISLIFYCADF